MVYLLGELTADVPFRRSWAALAAVNEELEERELSKEKLWPPSDRHTERRTNLTSSIVAHQTMPDRELDAVDGAPFRRLCSASALRLYTNIFPLFWVQELELVSLTEYLVAHYILRELEAVAVVLEESRRLFVNSRFDIFLSVLTQPALPDL